MSAEAGPVVWPRAWRVPRPAPTQGPAGNVGEAMGEARHAGYRVGVANKNGGKMP